MKFPSLPAKLCTGTTADGGTKHPKPSQAGAPHRSTQGGTCPGVPAIAPLPCPPQLRTVQGARILGLVPSWPLEEHA